MKRTKVSIIRNKNIETFTGYILGETNSHLFVWHGPFGEWFAKNSHCVQCENLN